MQNTASYIRTAYTWANRNDKSIANKAEIVAKSPISVAREDKMIRMKMSRVAIVANSISRSDAVIITAEVATAKEMNGFSNKKAKNRLATMLN